MYDERLGYAELPDPESCAYAEAEAWPRFAAAAMGRGQACDAAAVTADRMMTEFRRRFGTKPPPPADAE